MGRDGELREMSGVHCKGLASCTNELKVKSSREGL
jgi:hypothetical protein